MFIFKRRETYYVEYYDELLEKTRRVSTGKKSKAEATKFVSELRQQLKQRIKPQGILLSQFRDEYEEHAKSNHSAKYVKSIKLSFKMFVEFIDDPKLNMISVRDAERFITVSHRRAATAGHLYFRTLKAAFNKGVTWKYIETNPFKSVKPPKLVKRYPKTITKKDLDSIIEQVENKVLKELYLIAYYTGMRQSELANLKWDSIDLMQNVITVKNTDEFRTKSKKDRQIPISSIIIPSLKLMRKRKKTEYVFPNIQGYSYHPDTISHKFKAAVRDAELSDEIHFHCLRHSFASNLVRQGTSLYVVKELLGHGDISTTQIYSHLDNDSLAEAIKKLY